MRILLCLSALTLLWAESAFAQCTLTMTISDCIDPAKNAVVSAADNEKTDSKASTAREQRKMLGATNTGTVDGSASAISTALADFASKFRLGLDSADFGSKGKEGLSMEWSGLIRDALIATFFDEDKVLARLRNDHKFTLTLNEAKLFEPLAEQLTAEQKGDLEGDIGQTDDYTAAFSWSPVNRRHGRRISAHAEAFETLFEAAWKKTGGDVYAETSAKFEEPLRKMFHEIAGPQFSALEAKYGDAFAIPLQELIAICGSPCPRLTEAMEVFDQAREQRARLERDLEAEMNSGSATLLLKLVSNQPQWVITAKSRQRTAITGRDESNVKLSYELGGKNMRDLYAYRADCEKDAACIGEFVLRNAAKIDSGDRLAVSLEFSEKKGYEFSRAGFPTLALDRETSLIASVAYGRTFSLLDRSELLARKPAHLDLSWSFEDVSDDPMRNNRSVLNATITQEISQGAVLTLGLVYANKPEYRSQTDKDISARFGVNYKLGSSDRGM